MYLVLEWTKTIFNPLVSTFNNIQNFTINTHLSFTCDIVLDIQHVTEGIVVLEHVKIKWWGILPYLWPDAVVRWGPASSQDVIVPLGKVNQLSQGVVEATMETHHQLELWVRVQVHFSIGCILHLGDTGILSLLLMTLRASFNGQLTTRG